MVLQLQMPLIYLLTWLIPSLLKWFGTSEEKYPRKLEERSTERKRISKCLTEEAMAYFDGCISISTSDGSDLSAPEDPPRTSAGIFTPVSDDVSSPHQNSSINASLLYVSDCSSNSRKKMNDHDQLMPCSEDFDLKADGRFERVSISPRKKMIKKVKSGISKQSYQFSFAQRAKEVNSKL